MPDYVDPVTLDGQQLTLQAIGADDYSVRVLDQVAGRILLRSTVGGQAVWFWTITGPYLPVDMRPSHGEAETLLEAKAAFRAKFDAWLAWAKELQQPVMWME